MPAAIVIETRRCGLLGAGAYGSVRRARLHGSGAEVAVKSFLGSTAGCWPQTATREIVSLASMSAHPGVVPMHCAYMDERGKAHLVMPLLRTSLSEHVRCTLRGVVPAANVMAWSAQILNSVAHVHAAGFLHRDVKLENVLLDAAGNAVLGDFGMARHRVTGSELRPLTGNVCSLWTRCPELCVRVDSGARASHAYDDRVDAWSVGCVMLALAAGRYVIRSASAEHSTLPCIFQLLGLPSAQWPLMRSVGFSTAAYATLTRERQLANIMAACGDRSDLPPAFYSTVLELLSIDARERVTVQAVAARPEWHATWTPCRPCAGTFTFPAGAICPAAARGHRASMSTASSGSGSGPATASASTSDDDALLATAGRGTRAAPALQSPTAGMRRHAALWAWDVAVQTLTLHPLTALYGFTAWLRAVPLVVVEPGADLVLLAACCSLAAKMNDIPTVLPSAWTKACGTGVRVRQLHDAEHAVLRVLHGALVAGVTPRSAADGAAALALLAVTDWSVEQAMAHASEGDGASAAWRLACAQASRIAQAAAALREL
jgi:serine/threonine protein kinase